VAPVGASLAKEQQNSNSSSNSPLRSRYRQCIKAQSTRDDSSASIDEAKLRKELIKIEVAEPVVEQKAESAALTVAAAAAFGAGIWAVLGRAKAEGKEKSIDSRLITLILSIWIFHLSDWRRSLTHSLTHL
jgi:hypothetical protein